MYNLQPGTGLGFSAGKQMAFGLGTVFGVVSEIIAYMHKFIAQAVQHAFTASTD